MTEIINKIKEELKKNDFILYRKSSCCSYEKGSFFDCNETSIQEFIDFISEEIHLNDEQTKLKDVVSTNRFDKEFEEIKTLEETLKRANENYNYQVYEEIYNKIKEIEDNIINNLEWNDIETILGDFIIDYCEVEFSEENDNDLIYKDEDMNTCKKDEAVYAVVLASDNRWDSYTEYLVYDLIDERLRIIY